MSRACAVLALAAIACGRGMTVEEYYRGVADLEARWAVCNGAAPEYGKQEVHCNGPIRFDPVALANDARFRIGLGKTRFNPVTAAACLEVMRAQVDPAHCWGADASPAWRLPAGYMLLSTPYENKGRGWTDISASS